MEEIHNKQILNNPEY